MRTPLGFAVAPGRNGQVVPPDEFNDWPEAKRVETEAAVAALEKDLEHIIHQIPLWQKQRRDEIREHNRETARYAASQLIDEAVEAFRDIPRIIQHIETVRADVVENVEMFVAKSEDTEDGPADGRPGYPFERYEVNVLVTQDGQGAPVIEELHPTLGNLTGRIEYVSLRGVLVTNFRLIKAGAMHRANGGYLLLDARSVLMEPFTWAALKRTLRRGEITIEDAGRFMGLTSTVSLEPEPIPLKVKAVLFGDRLLYFLLAELDPELSEHFKVLADFEDDFARSAETEAVFAKLLARLIRPKARPYRGGHWTCPSVPAKVIPCGLM